MAKVTLYLVRHGQTYYNIFNKLQGWSNSPLTDKGKQDAVKAGERLKNTTFKAAYCSDTTRAQQTCQTILDINLGGSVAEPVATPFFREAFYGYFEGLNMDEAWYMTGAPHGVPSFKAIMDKYSMAAAKDFMKAADPFHMAEDNADYWQRVDQGLALIRQDERLSDGDNALVVSHGNTLLSLAERFSEPGQYDLTSRPANGSLTKIALDDSGATVLSYNE